MLKNYMEKASKHPGENARSWEALGEARPGQSRLSAGAVRYLAWAQSWSSAALAARSVLPSNINGGSERKPRVGPPAEKGVRERPLTALATCCIYMA